MIDYALDEIRPIAIRYPNGREQSEIISRFSFVSTNPTCRLLCDFDQSSIPEYIFITYGSLLARVVKSADILRSEGMSVGIIVVETIKPYNDVAKEIMRLTSSAKRIVYAEEGIKNGGAAEITREALINLGLDTSRVDYRIAAIDDNFASPDYLCDLYDYTGLSAEKLARKMKD
jgi:transketolase C-terminal domain/subunit